MGRPVHRARRGATFQSQLCFASMDLDGFAHRMQPFLRGKLSRLSCVALCRDSPTTHVVLCSTSTHCVVTGLFAECRSTLMTPAAFELTYR
jgi:hypothetical protein